jgi:hypothetical protein
MCLLSQEWPRAGREGGHYAVLAVPLWCVTRLLIFCNDAAAALPQEKTLPPSFSSRSIKSSLAAHNWSFKVARFLASNSTYNASIFSCFKIPRKKGAS